jgi:Ser/Thr protein kinase RdoA (MazF antagonist)
VVIHGDWAIHNLLRTDGRMTGVIDFELARRDVRIAEFCLAWRGAHDELVRGYDAVAPLSDAERRLLVPVWWAYLVESAGQLLARGEWDDGWIVAKLQRRSPLFHEWGD